MATLHLTEDQHTALSEAVHTAIDDLADHIAHDDTHPAHADPAAQAERRARLAQWEHLAHLLTTP